MKFGRDDRLRALVEALTALTDAERRILVALLLDKR
jgi:hypothetical protein